MYVGLCFAIVGVQSWGSIKYCFSRCNVTCIGRNLEEKEEENKIEKIAFGFQFPVISYSHLISSHVGALKAGHFVADLFRFVRVHFPIKADG